MDDETTENLMTLKEVNLALLEGLKLASHVMTNWDQLEDGRSQTLIESVDRLIDHTEMIYQTDQHQH